MPSEPPLPPGRERSWIARAAPSWTFDGYRVANGYALLSVVLGFVSAVFVSAPGGALVAPGAVLGLGCAAAARAGRRRARSLPWVGGYRMATAGPVLVAIGVVLALVWLVIGA